MSQNSKIEWTEATWNPLTGCSKISDGCQNCYAERLAATRLSLSKKYANGFSPTVHHELFEQPARWSTPRRIFVCSMGDLFHEAFSDEDVRAVIDTMIKVKRHQYLILTKRPERAASILPRYGPELCLPPNVLVGTTIESEKYLSRLDHLLRIPARRFISFEPLIGYIHDIRLGLIEWVIVGGETGPDTRPMDLDWARRLRDEAQRQKAKFFFKKVGGRSKLRLLDGKEWNELPDIIDPKEWRTE